MLKKGIYSVVQERRQGQFGSAFFRAFQIEINTIIIYENHFVVGEVCYPVFRELLAESVG